jgi:hypothetical protein
MSRTLRSKFPNYRVTVTGVVDGKTKPVGAVCFHNNTAVVDEETFAQLRKNPYFGDLPNHGDFWPEDERAVAKAVAENPIEPVTDPAAGGESETGGTATGANGEGQAAKTPPPLTAAEKKAADKAAKEAAKAEAKGN